MVSFRRWRSRKGRWSRRVTSWRKSIRDLTSFLQAQYEGQLARDQGILAQARVDLARYKTLAEQNSIARQQYEDQIYIVQQDEGTVKLDQALIDQQKLNVTYCHIVSPVTGRIGLRLVDPGNYLQTTNNTGVAVVTQLQPITVIFPVPEDDLRRHSVAN